MDQTRSAVQRPFGKRKRARKACLNCNRRKVKCDVATVGQPCANCSADEIICEVVPRKKRVSNVKPKATSREIESEESPVSVERTVTRSITTAGRNVENKSTTPASSDEGANTGALAAAIDDEEENQAKAALGNQTDIYYAGNTHGAVSFVSHVAGTAVGDQNVHYLLKHTAHKPLSAEDLQYLRHKGAFTVPPDNVCDSLIRAYFLHVHPLLPILEANTFLNQVTRNGCKDVNLLLLWSMIFMAAGFIDRNTVRASGFASRKAMKRAAYERAKVLYDISQDHDQLTLIQAVILMGHWHDDAEDRFEAWHWTGIAISLCQTVGLHCSPIRPKGRSSAIDLVRERLCRRIWWTCVCRDRWLSMVKGRPMRIRLEDGNVSLPIVEDVQFDLQQIPDDLKNRYFPLDASHISYLWCKQVEISVLVGRILLREAFAAPFGRDQLSEMDLLKCDWPPGIEPSMHVFEKMCEHHVRLLYNASCIAYWRPLILVPQEGSADYSIQQEAIVKSRLAATKSNTVLEELAAQDMLKYMKSQTITALVPAMQIHLLDSESSTKSISMLGLNRLQLCMEVLIELRETYWAADFAIKLFERAREKIALRKRLAKRPNRTASSGSTEETLVPRTFSSSSTSPSSLYLSPTTESLMLANEIFVPGSMFWEEPASIDTLWNDTTFGSTGFDFNSSMSLGNLSTTV